MNDKTSLSTPRLFEFLGDDGEWRPKRRGGEKRERRKEKKKGKREHDNVLLPAAATFPIRRPRKLIIAHFSLNIVVVYLSRNDGAVCVHARLFHNVIVVLASFERRSVFE